MLFKDDIRKLADLKQQISQKRILVVQHIPKKVTVLRSNIFFVMFAVLNLRVCRCRP